MNTKFTLATMYAIGWGASLPALFFSFVLSALVLAGMSDPLGKPIIFTLCFLFLMNIFFAWLSLGVMTFNAIKKRRLARWWPLAGTFSGLLCCLVVAIMRASDALLFVIPALVFAIHLVRFHLGFIAPAAPATRTPR